MLQSGKKIKPKQNALFRFKLMSCDKESFIHYIIHMRMSTLATTCDCKKYLKQLMVPEFLIGVYRNRGSHANGKISNIQYHITENNGRSERKECFLANVMFLILPFRIPCLSCSPFMTQIFKILC